MSKLILLNTDSLDNQMTNKISLFFVFIFFGILNANSQTWTAAGVLWKDQIRTVLLEYKIEKNICEPNSFRKSMWKYKVTGKSSKNDLFLNWDMDFVNCENRIITRSNYVNIGNFENYINGNDIAEISSLDYDFNGKSVETYFYNVHTSLVPDIKKDRERVNKFPVPEKIIGNTNINFGESVELSVVGPDLAPPLKWVWYKNSCGGVKIGEGLVINQDPKVNSEYFVRAENDKYQSKCVQIRIQVNPDSEKPDSIEGPKIVCSTDSVLLKVRGGRLGLKANWEWTKNDCNGIPFASGEEVYVKPGKGSLYFVKAVGKSNTTECKSIEILIDNKYTNPDSIQISAYSICSGNSVNLKLFGGQISDFAKWVWYNDKEIENYGTNIIVSPLKTTNFYVRAEGPCGVTEFIKKQIKVIENSIPPDGIIINPELIYKNSKVNLSIKGGSLARESQWVWYDNNQLLNPIGSSNNIEYNFKKTTTIYVRSESNCFKSTPVEGVVKVLNRVEKFKFINLGVITPDFSNGEPISNFVVTAGVKKKTGVYIKAKFSLNSASSAKYTTTDAALLDYTIYDAYYKYNSNQSISRLSITSGILFGSNNLILYAGAGYGMKNLYWGIDEKSIQGGTIVRSSWAKNVGRSISGPELDAGFIIRASFINIIGGISCVYSIGTNQYNPSYTTYFDTHFGIGVNF